MKNLFTVVLLFLATTLFSQSNFGTPIGTPNAPTHQYWFYILTDRGDGLAKTAAASRKMIIINDSTNIHFTNKYLYLDSMGGGWISGNGIYLATIDSATNRVGSSKFSTLFDARYSTKIKAPTAIASGAKSFNTAYQVSSTNASNISVSPQITCALSLTGGASGIITLDISPNGTSGWITVGTLPGSNTGTLTIGLATSQISGGQLSYDLPIGYYYRMTTNNVTGTPTYTFNGGAYKIY